jgi:phage-related minor tail protein
VAVVVGDAAVRVRPDTDKFEDDAEGGIVGAMSKLGGKGAAAMGAAIGGALAIGEGFSQALERGALSDRLAASLGLTEGKSAEVGKVAGNLFANAYGDSMETVNAAVGAVMTSIDGMATASSADLEALTGTALNFATTFDVDVNRATQIAGQLMRTGLAKDGTEAFDLLTAASQKVPAALREDVLDAADEYGTFFASLGYSGSEAFGTLVKGAEQGMYGIDKAGDAIKEFTIRATDMSASSTAAYDSIGLDAQTMANRILAGGDTAKGATQKIIDGLLKIKDPATQANTAIALFGTPLEDIGTAKVPEFLKSLSAAGGGLGDVSGAADRMGQTLNDNASTNMTQFMRTAQSLAVDFLGGQVIPKVQEVSGWLNDHFGPAVSYVAGIITDDIIPAVKDFTGWVDDNSTTISVIAAVIAAVFIPHLLALAAQAVLTGATTAAMWVASKVGAIQAAAVHSAQIAGMIVRWIALGAQAVASAAVVVAQWVWMGIQAAASAARTAAAWVAAQIRTVISLAVMAAGFVAQGAVMVASVAATVAGVVAGWVLMAAQSLIQAARMAAAWFIALGPIGWIIAAVIGLVALIIANWETVKGWTIAAFTAIWGFIQGVWEWIKGAISAALGFIGDAIKWYLNMWWTVISTVFNAVVTVVTTVWNTIGNAIRGALDWIWGIITGAFNKIKDFVGSVFSGIASTVGAVWDGIGAAIKTAINGIIGTINKFVIGGVNVLIDGVNLVNPFSDVPHIPSIPKLHSGGIFDSGQGEGLALLRDQERVITPQQRLIADRLLGDLLSGTIAAGTAMDAATGGGLTVHNEITQQPGESGAVLAARVTQDTVWRLNAGITRRIGATGALA